LKYGGPQTDFDRLQAELSGQPVPVPDPGAEDMDESDDPYASDPYAKYYEEEDESA
jgi:hypothetical protein